MSKPTNYPIKKLVFLSERQAEAISDYRFKARINSENEAIRQLIEAGLTTVGATSGAAVSGPAKRKPVRR